MFSNEPQSHFGQNPGNGRLKFGQPRPHVIETTIQSCEIQIEKKVFALALKENPRGRFLRITEMREPKYATVIVPSSGFKDFQRILADLVVSAGSEFPTKK